MVQPSGEYVVLLGTKGGPSVRPGTPMPTSNLVVMGGEWIVVDCGPGVTRALTDQGMALKDLKSVLVTHLHSDHYLELGPLLHTAWTSGLKTTVSVWGPAGLEKYWVNFLKSMEDDINLRISDEGRPDLAGLVSIHPLDEGEVAKIGEVAVSALRVEHPPLVDCFALSFASAASRVVFSGDTARFDPLVEFARGADLLIHEAMLEVGLESLMGRIGNGDERLMEHWQRAHTLAADAAQIADKAGVGALALTHLIPSDDPEVTEDSWRAEVRAHWSGPFHLGHDGRRIELAAPRG